METKSALETAEGKRYLESLSRLISRLGQVGTIAIAPDELHAAQRHIAAAQVSYLVRNDTPDQYYARAFSHLGIGSNTDELDPELLLEHLVYRAADLVGGGAQQLRLVSGLPSGGRVFHSSGTTNPSKRKGIFYDSTTLSVLRQLNGLTAEGATGFPLTSRTHALLMMPPEATLGMPFAFFVSDLYAAFGVGIHWGARFLNPPTPALDPVFGVETAELAFKDNVAPNPISVKEFQTACVSAPGPHIVEGLLPTLHGLLCTPGAQAGTLRPSVVNHGGGLKRAGIPPRLLSTGGAALESYLDRIREVTGNDPREYGALREDRPAQEEAALDTLLTVFLSYEVEQATGARCLNNYAGAEILPVFYSAGTFSELYGQSYFRLEYGEMPSSLFIPPPGAAIQLRDPTTDKIIPKSDTQRPGVLRLWNPFNVSHLHAIETEDLLSWSPLPAGAAFRPAYAEGVGLRYRGRLASAAAGGYCA